MQENVLEANPAAEIHVYVVWEPMLGARRNRAAEATELISDPRVRHYWNDDFIVGEFFKDHDSGRTAWDIYFLYGPEAVWQEEPEPLLLSGRTVIRKRQALHDALAELWQQTELATNRYHWLILRTSAAWGPSGPSSTVNVTLSPSSR